MASVPSDQPVGETKPNVSCLIARQCAEYARLPLEGIVLFGPRPAREMEFSSGRSRDP